MEELKIGFTALAMIGSILTFYHKFIMKEIDKKVDQKLHDVEFINLREQIKQNYKIQQKQLESISTDLELIKKHLICKK